MCSRNYVVIVIVTRCAINNLPTIYAPTGRPRLVIQSGLQVAATPIQCHPFSQRTNRTEGTRTPTTATAAKNAPKVLDAGDDKSRRSGLPPHTKRTIAVGIARFKYIHVVVVFFVLFLACNCAAPAPIVRYRGWIPRGYSVHGLTHPDERLVWFQCCSCSWSSGRGQKITYFHSSATAPERTETRSTVHHTLFPPSPTVAQFNIWPWGSGLGAVRSRCRGKGSCREVSSAGTGSTR